MNFEENQNAALYFVDRHKNKLSEKIAFIEVDGYKRSITYGQLSTKTQCMANLYERHEIHREERVAMLVLDSIDFPIIFWGSLKSGIIPIPLNTLLPAEIYRIILNDSRAQVLFISQELLSVIYPILADTIYLKTIFVIGDNAEKLENNTPIKITSFEHELSISNPSPCVKVSSDESAFWLYSSGSTGAPKGVCHVHGSLMATSSTYGKNIISINENDVVFSAAKMFFAYGLGNNLTIPMSVGATVYVCAGRATPESVLNAIQQSKPTIFFGVPTLFSSMLAYIGNKKPEGVELLRHCVSAGEALPKNVGEQWYKLIGVDILDGVGSTEMLHIFLSNSPDNVVYGTSGKAVAGYEVKLINENNDEVNKGEIGELLVKGDSAATSYWNQRDKSQSTFEGVWTRTGDKYTENQDGTYFYCGRTDDMFKVSGIWVSPFEIEQALISSDEVLEAAVVAKEDDVGLLKPIAFVVLQPNENKEGLAEALKELIKTKIGKWKYPRWIEFVDELPKTSTGKIQRFKLRKI